MAGIIRFVRTFVLLLMVALLPLRMWAADGMAVRMAQGQAFATTGVAAMATMPEDCPMMAKAEPREGDGGAPHATHCTACHLCAPSAGLPAFAFGPGPAPAGPPVSTGASFDDADLAPDLRPPIA